MQQIRASRFEAEVFNYTMKKNMLSCTYKKLVVISLSLSLCESLFRN